jgi:hypothetical protein
MSLEKSERYLLIGIDEDSEWAQVTSFIRKYTTFLDKRCEQYPESYKKESDQFDEDEIVGREYIVKKRLLPPTLFKAPSKKKLTEEQKQAASERMRKMQKARQKKVKDKG